MRSSEEVQRHPELTRILSALLDGRPCSEIAQEFGLEQSAVHSYAIEAGLLPGRPAVREPAPSAPASDALEREEPPTLGPEEMEPRQPVSASVHEREVLEEGARRRGQPAGQRPDPAETLREERDASFKELLRASRAEDQAYREQPTLAIGGRLREDPLGQAGFELHVGIQPASRLLALTMRDRVQREARRAEWFADPFHWHQKPPAWWFEE